MNLLQLLKTYIKNTPKSVLAIGVIGVCSLVAAIVLVLSIDNAATQTAVQTTSATSSSSTPSHEQGANAATVINSNAATGKVAGVSTNTPNASAPSQPATNTDTNNKTANKASSSTPTSNATSGTTNGNTPASTPTTPTQPVAPKADYNLNEMWYFAIATTGGIYNTCWPTALTQSNEAQCGDLNSIYSYPHTIFSGIGISKNAETAKTLAGNHAYEKAQSQHVDPRLGGGDEAIVLAEALCSQYGLSCGRW